MDSCNECLRLHGAAPRNGSSQGFQFIPTGFVKDLSSAYCAMPTATMYYTDFAGNFSITHPVSFGSQTGSTDLLHDKTAVSDYFTSTPITASSSSSTMPTSSVLVSGGATGSITQQTSTATSASPQAIGGAGTAKVSRLLGIGMLGVAWFL